MIQKQTDRSGAHPGQDAATGRSDDPSWALVLRTPKRDVPYLPSDGHVVEAMLDFAQVGAGDVLYDLGCGDGRIVLAAARRGARAVGVDIDPQRLQECHENTTRLGMTRWVRFIRASFFDIDLRDATVVTLYLLPGVNVKLRPKLLWELPPGARVISNNFDMKDWPADVQATYHYRTLHKWLVPAWAQGRWRCVVDQPQSRWRMSLNIRRRFQRLDGEARVGGKWIRLSDGRILGERIHFTLWHPEHFRPAVHFTGRIAGSAVRGKCQPLAGGVPVAWCGWRDWPPPSREKH